MKNIIFLLSIITITSFSLIETQESFAYYDIGIRLDKTCEAMIDAGNPSNCPTYEEIEKVFAEIKLKEEYQNLIDSEQDKGDIISNNGKIETHSQSCIKYEQCNIFDLNPIHTAHYWHNPSELLSRSMDVITIQPNMKIKNPVYLKYNEISIITENNKRQINFEINQLYLSDNCKDAVFAPGYDWRAELGHLIYYMMQNCQDINYLTGVFDLSYTEETDVHYFDPLTSPNYNYRLWMAEAKEMCKIKC